MLYEPRVLKECRQCHKWLVDNTENFRARDKWTGSHCRVCCRRNGAEYRTVNRGRVAKSQSCYRQSHKVQIDAYNLRYRTDSADKVKASAAKYRRSHPELCRERRKRSVDKKPDVYRRRHLVRRTRVRSAPTTFTVGDWKRCLNYWHGACAYCGHGPSMFDRYQTLHQDHFIPVSQQGGYTPDNILPACQSCNLNKNNKDAEQWLAERFGKRHGQAILKAIYVYFAHVNNLQP